MNDMNELTNKLQQVMVPKAALIAYEYRENRYGNGMHYLELHPINDRGRMEAAMPVTYEFMDSLVESYTDDRRNVPHGKIPANMLWCDTRKGHERYIWYNPPGKRQTFSKLLEYWEKRFWLSEFSHLGGSRNPTGSNLVSVTEKARANPFDENELKPMNKQLKDLLA